MLGECPRWTEQRKRVVLNLRKREEKGLDRVLKSVANRQLMGLVRPICRSAVGTEEAEDQKMTRNETEQRTVKSEKPFKTHCEVMVKVPVSRCTSEPN